MAYFFDNFFGIFTENGYLCTQITTIISFLLDLRLNYPEIFYV